MSAPGAITALYRLFRSRRTAGLWCVGLFLAASLAGMFLVRPTEDIASMIPDGRSGLAGDFRLLRLAPFTSRVVIDVSAPDSADTDGLIAAVDALAAALPKDLFGQVGSGPGMTDPASFVAGMLDLLPALFTGEDARRASALMEPEAVRLALRLTQATLTSPEGIGMTRVLRMDPLGLRSLALAKLASLRMSREARLEQGRFISRDGRHMALIAKPVPDMTDAKGAAAVLAAFEAAKASLPPGYSATFTGGVRHTLANATAIKADMSTVLAASTAGLALIFLVFLRTRSGLLAFLLPLSIVPPAAVATRLAFGSISGITLGFGSVLMGVAADYSIYIYYTLRGVPGNPEAALTRAAAPVWYGAATSLMSFAALLFSGIPGIRELAFFSIVGLVLAMFLALVVLPCVIGPAAAEPAHRAWTGPRRIVSARAALALAAALVLAGAVLGRDARFDSDLRSLSAAGQDIQRDEQAVRDIWGGPSDRVMVFASGGTLDAALTANRDFNDRAGRGAGGSMVSLDEVLPPRAVQEENIARWRALFTPEAVAALTREISAEAGALGFTPAAFDPFRTFLEAANPPMATPDRLRATGLGEAVDMLLTRDGDGYVAVSLADEGQTVPPELADRVRAVSRAAFATGLTELVKADFLRFILIALAGNLALLFWFLGSARMTLLSVMPTAVGLAALFGVMGWLGRPFDIFGVIAIPLVIGIGVDYGIFVAMEGAGDHNGGTLKAVFVAGITTVAGFGALVLARHPALHSIGLTVLIGISGTLAASCLLAPSLARRP